MKNLRAISILIFAFCASAFAQTNQNTTCPTVEINFKFPERAKDPFIFTAIIIGETGNITPKYIWSSGQGKIIEGQGTTSIKVLSDKGEANVRVKIEGFAEGCSPSAEDSVVIDYGHPILIEKFSMPLTVIDKGKLDDLVLELKNHKYARIYVVEYFQDNTPPQLIKQKLRKTSDYLINTKKLNKDSFKLVSFLFKKNTSFKQNITIFWIIPDGAEFPEP